MALHADPAQSYPPPHVRPLGTPPVGHPPLDHPHPFFAEVRPDHAESSQVVDHVSNVHYLRWLDRAAELHMDAQGWTRDSLLSAGHMWFVARHEIDYRAEVHAGDVLHLGTWVRDIRRAKSWRDTVLWRQNGNPDDEPQVVCTASTLWVLVELESRRPRRVPAAMAAAMNPLVTRGLSD
ncbi:MAG: acyl-CoA thioesterase [Phycisphaerales bacterium]|nr:acyl-CoA thioesterase [Phycisphaerales bacterium]